MLMERLEQVIAVDRQEHVLRRDAYHPERGLGAPVDGGKIDIHAEALQEVRRHVAPSFDK